MCHKNNKLLRGYVSQLNVTESMESLHGERCSMLKDAKQSMMDMKVVQDTEIAQYCKTELDYSPARSSTIRQNEEEDVSGKEVMSKRLQNEDKSLVNLVVCSDSLSNKSNLHDTPFVKDELGILDYGIRNQFLGSASLLNQMDDRFHCTLCSRSFTQKLHLEKHLMNHSGKISHNCNLCNKTFSRKLHLERHMLTHSGKRAHHCSLCSKSFILKSHLNGHMVTHTGIKSHHCTLCSKNFARKSDLHRHMLIHTVDRSYGCSYCNKSFARKSHLARHMIFHSGKRPHHCTVCSKSFILKSHLNDHMLTHTGVKSHHCTVCMKSFGRKSDLNRHMLIHNNEKLQNYNSL